VRGVKVLYACAEGARETLQEGLDELGAIVDRVTVYQSVVDGEGAAALRETLLDTGADLVTFTSASSVRSFVDAVGEEAARRAPAASIGPVTSEAARAAGLDVIVEAERSTIVGLAEAIVEHFVAAGVA
jgi:uroporphyrinogen III methyltransferase / synthase